jgi:dUTP pyrophosphatase
MQKILVKKIDPRATLPDYQTPGAAAFDIALLDDLVIPPRALAKTRTGLVIQVPEKHFLQIASRSSNALKKGIGMANGIGVIDGDYCGPNDEIFLVIANLTDTEIKLSAGERVAQGLILPVTRVAIEEVVEMTSVDRGGHGSTGA